MKQKATLLTLFLISAFQLIGQSFSELPSVKSQFEKVKANPKVYEKLKKDYGITNPKACKFELTHQGRDGTLKSDWWVRQSNYAKKMERKTLVKYPQDKATVTFTVTTPKNSDGISYVLPLEIKYSKFLDGVLTQKWNYYYWQFKDPYKIDGKLNEKEFFDMMMTEVKTFKHEFDPGGYPECPRFLCGYYKINSITSSEIPDKISKASNREEIIRYFNVDGNYQYMPGSSYDSVKDHRLDRKIAFAVSFTRNLKYGDQKESPWKVNEFLGHSSKTINKGESVPVYEVMPTIERFGYNYVFQKDNDPIGKAYFSNGYVDDWEDGVNRALKKLNEGDETGLDDLKKYTTTEEIAMSFAKIYKEAKSKMISVGENSYSNTNNGIKVRYGNGGGFSEGTKVTFRFALTRKSCDRSDKDCVKRLKEAGMSKAIIKSGQYFKSDETEHLKLTIKNNKAYISEPLTVEKAMTF